MQSLVESMQKNPKETEYEKVLNNLLPSLGPNRAPMWSSLENQIEFLAIKVVISCFKVHVSTLDRKAYLYKVNLYRLVSLTWSQTHIMSVICNLEELVSSNLLLHRFW